MFSRFCESRLNELEELVERQENFMKIFCVLNLVFSLMAVIGNFLLIRALWEASSITANIKKLFLSLAFSDLAVGLFSQLCFGVLIAIMLNSTSTGEIPFCPTVLNASYFLIFCFLSASFLNITAIAIDRLLAIWLHLRYREFVTPKRVVVALVSIWSTSSVGAISLLLLPQYVRTVFAVANFAGFLLMTVAYGHLYKAVRYHQNQIQTQLQLQNSHAAELLREKKACYNALFVYAVFLACFLPVLTSTTLLTFQNLRGVSFLLYDHVAVFLALLNSSLDPVVYYWRCREIRENVKNTVKKVFFIHERETQGERQQ